MENTGVITKKIIPVQELLGIPRFAYNTDEKTSSVLLRLKKRGDWALEPVVFIEYKGKHTLKEMLNMIASNLEARSWAAASVKRAEAAYENFILFLDNVERCYPKEFSYTDFLIEKGIMVWDDLQGLKFNHYCINEYDKNYKNLPDATVW